ncbi:MAG: 50S ribosomal protein L11 methyltransferase [Myxococcales bacterium]
MGAYSLGSYASMLACRTRMPAYFEALERTVKPGSVVLDLGAGFGYFALLACRLGAARVYAIEPAESISVAAELARLNGFGDRIVPIRDSSRNVKLPERVDVIVSDIRGALPTIGGSLRTLIDARDRLLAPGGTLIPWRDRLWVAPIDDRPQWQRSVRPWAVVAEAFEPARGLNLTPVEERLVHYTRSSELLIASFMATPQIWAEIDYHTNQNTDVEGAVEFQIAERGTVYTLGIWFDAELMEGIRYASGPERGTVYANMSLPLSQPLSVQPGDTLKVRLLSSDIGGTYHLSWWTSLIRGGQTLSSFQQSDFLSEPLVLDRFKQRLPNHMPKLERRAEIVRQILDGAHAGLSLGQIAAKLMENFPDRFESTTAALEHAANAFELFNG